MVYDFLKLSKMKDSLKAVIRQEIKLAIQAEMVVLEQRLTKIIEEKLKESVTSVFEDLTGIIKDLEKKVEQNEQFNMDLEKRVRELQKENEEIKENFNSIDGQMDLIQVKLMQNALRLRGILEGDERLIDVSSRVLAQLINAQPLDISRQIEKIFRVNSQIAKQNNLPRDIVIYFKDKGLRDEIVQASYNKDIQEQGWKVWIFKEIPLKILMQRKKLSFLTNELRNRQIRYKWEIPFGLSFTYEGKKYLLNTTQKAEDFYKDFMISGPAIKFEPEQAEKLLLLDTKEVQKVVPSKSEVKKDLKINDQIKSSPKPECLHITAKDQKKIEKARRRKELEAERNKEWEEFHQEINEILSFGKYKKSPGMIKLPGEEGRLGF